jgi:hypothetical protein
VTGVTGVIAVIAAVTVITGTVVSCPASAARTVAEGAMTPGRDSCDRRAAPS